MNMKHILSVVAIFVTIQASAQQVNPVPDYVFRNQMSVGRNAVTDTAAYFSIGPRYGATKGLMPPIVGDTASFSGNKRNGLLIFSVQKNKFLYWDSVGVKWAEMAGTGGTAISSGDTAAMLLPYVRHAGYGLTKSGQSFLVDTAAMATRARVQKGIDSVAGLSRIGGSGTTNYLPKFTASGTIGNSVAFDNGGTELLVNTTIDSGAYALQVAGSIFNTTGAVFARNSGQVGIGVIPSYKLDVSGFLRATGNVYLSTDPSTTFTRIGTLNDLGIGQLGVVGDGGTNINIGIYNPSTTNGVRIIMNDNTNGAEIRTIPGTSMTFRANGVEGMRLNNSRELIIDNAGTDAGDYKLQVVGNIYNTGSITTGAPSGGSIKPWKIGEAATVSPTSPNRTLRVEVDGVVYYIHAKTTND